MSKLYINICLMFATIVLLIGCGFTLRNAQSLPQQLHKIYYQSDTPFDQFDITFKKALKSSGVVLLTEVNNSLPALLVTSNYISRSISSASSSSGRVYNLNYTATISISDSFGKLLLSSQTAVASRDVTLMPGEVFEIAPQIEIVKQELMRELSTKILNILCSKKTFQSFVQ